ncbi:MAG: hypothetical protein D6683_09665 [Actinomyces sp.]|nr:MAG: hypothetical protein D6683_09665 [Actinomyces sp.]
MASLPVEPRAVVDPDGALDLFRAPTRHRWPYDADHALHRFERMMRRAGRRSLLAPIWNRYDLHRLVPVSPRSGVSRHA